MKGYDLFFGAKTQKDLQEKCTNCFSIIRHGASRLRLVSVNKNGTKVCASGIAHASVSGGSGRPWNQRRATHVTCTSDVLSLAERLTLQSVRIL